MDIGEVIADESLQETGIWIPYRDGAEFLIAYSGRKKYRDKLGKVSARARRMNRGRDLGTAEIDSVTVEAMIDTVLLDWKGITKDGKPYTYTKENAEWWLRRSPELRDFIFGEATNLANFQPPEGEAESESPQAQLKSGSDVSAGTGERPASVEGHGGDGNGSPSTPEPS
jgi:hypothetical protein